MRTRAVDRAVSCNSARLPSNLAAKLNIPWASDTKVGIKAPIISRGRDRASNHRGRFGKVWMVEGIEKRRSKLK